ncbi:MAG: hypothetical protein C0596_00875 [Marinilabiliales bacterium]|nr:MAG: hypothetical protein C0596_00875 [Marinilabiliales bacterium]
MKTKLTSLILILLCFLLRANAQDEITTDTVTHYTFETLLDSTGMTFTPPKGFIEIEPVSNYKMNYQKAYKHPTENIEIRYTIVDHDLDWHFQFFLTTTYNISIPMAGLPEYDKFEAADMQELNADIGYLTMVMPNEEFAEGYSLCILFYMYKHLKGDAYVFYLFDDKEALDKILPDVFYNLRYN